MQIKLLLSTLSALVSVTVASPTSSTPAGATNQFNNYQLVIKTLRADGSLLPSGDANTWYAHVEGDAINLSLSNEKAVVVGLSSNGESEASVINWRRQSDGLLGIKGDQLVFVNSYPPPPKLNTRPSDVVTQHFSRGQTSVPDKNGKPVYFLQFEETKSWYSCSSNFLSFKEAPLRLFLKEQKDSKCTKVVIYLA